MMSVEVCSFERWLEVFLEPLLWLSMFDAAAAACQVIMD